MGPLLKICMALWMCVAGVSGVGAYSKTPKQYHIQTDEGPDRYFRFQTFNGQFRKEKRFDDGTVVGTYGWVDPNGLLRLYDYIADHLGYRIVRQRTMQVPPIVEPPAPPPQSPKPFQRQPVVQPQSVRLPQPVVTQSPIHLRPQPVRRRPTLIPPTQLRPVSRTRPAVSSSVVPGINELESENREVPGSSPVGQKPKLRPILVPLSQATGREQPFSKARPVSHKTQLFSPRQQAPRLTSNPLLPVSNDVSFGKAIAGSPVINPTVAEAPSPSVSFGEKVTSASEAPRSPDTSSRKRFRGRPLAARRQPAAASTSKSTPHQSRGTVRFRGEAKSLLPNREEESRTANFGIPSSNNPQKSRVANTIGRQDPATNAGTGDITPLSATNTAVTYDLPSDLPYTINYDLGNQFHMEKTLPDGTKVGKHGYVDPLGVLRVTHYSTGPNGHHEKQVNKWVGVRHPEEQK